MSIAEETQALEKGISLERGVTGNVAGENSATPDCGYPLSENGRHQTAQQHANQVTFSKLPAFRKINRETDKRRGKREGRAQAVARQKQK